MISLYQDRERECLFLLCVPLSLFAFVVCFFAGVLFGIWIWIFSVAWIGYYSIAVHRGWCARLCGWRNAFECDFGVYTYLQRLVSICRHSFSFSHSLCQRSPRPLYSGRWAPHTYAFTRKIVYIRVPSDLTEATRVSIHTQSARPSCWVNANELIENRCLSSSSSLSVGVCSSLCPSWATMLARRLPFFCSSRQQNMHTHTISLVVVLSIAQLPFKLGSASVWCLLLYTRLCMSANSIYFCRPKNLSSCSIRSSSLHTTVPALLRMYMLLVWVSVCVCLSSCAVGV